MSSLRHVRSWAADLLAIVVLLGFALPIKADPKPLTKEEQDKIDKAIDKGVRYLKRVQHPSGTFPTNPDMNKGSRRDPRRPYLIGETLLPALALLECGVPPKDPAIQKVATLTRKYVRKVDKTYELSLALMFLDRLGEDQDEELIRTVALRLMAGQTYTGGWSYRCPLLKSEQEAEFLKALSAAEKRIVATKRPPREGLKRNERQEEPEIPSTLNKLAVFQKPELLIARAEADAPESLAGITDNSNTQFATLGLWAARKHDIPVLPTFQLIVRRFACSQYADGTWSYRYRFGGENRHLLDSRAWLPTTNTGAGLLGLAIGCAELPTDGAEAKKRETQIIWALAVLSKVIGDHNNQLVLREYGEPYYYLLWTIERVATLYNLPEIGEQDWYRWGATILLSYQKPGGEWPHLHDKSYMASFSDSLNTAFALLFLKRSNLVKDLTAKLPLKPNELNKGIARVLTGDRPLEPPTDAPSRNEKPKR